jgi:rod shape-determining protein MreC
MPASDFQPYPAFRRGVSAKVRFLIYATACILLLVGDLHFDYLKELRTRLHENTSFLRTAASQPVKLLGDATEHLSGIADLQKENEELKQKKDEDTRKLQTFDALEQENIELRKLLGMRDRTPVKSIAAEVLSSVPDPSSRKVIIDQGRKAGISRGLAVVDANGLIGQVTRVYDTQSEVTLITDRNQAVSVQVLRNGLRGVLFGTEQGTLELRFVLAHSDIGPRKSQPQKNSPEGQPESQPDGQPKDQPKEQLEDQPENQPKDPPKNQTRDLPKDRLVTSGLDGEFLYGLPVAEVESVDNNAGAFAHITCRPLGGVEKSMKVLVLGRAVSPPERPKPEDGDPPPPKSVRQPGGNG